MRVRLYYSLVLLVHIILSLDIGVSSKHFAPPNGALTDHVNNQGEIHNSQSSQITGHNTSNRLKGSEMGIESVEKSAKNMKEMKKRGSKPPSCEHKCYGCMPCEAIQVPTTSSRVGLQYTNYEPEGWKCKCGPIFYSP